MSAIEDGVQTGLWVHDTGCCGWMWTCDSCGTVQEYFGTEEPARASAAAHVPVCGSTSDDQEGLANRA